MGNRAHGLVCNLLLHRFLCLQSKDRLPREKSETLYADPIFPQSPGRFYGAAMMKVMLSQVIIKYDCELVNKDAPRWWTWRSSMLPKEDTMVIFRPLHH